MVNMDRLAATLWTAKDEWVSPFRAESQIVSDDQFCFRLIFFWYFLPCCALSATPMDIPIVVVVYVGDMPQ